VGRKIKLDPWIEAGAAAAATPAEAAEGADVLCVCVTDKAAVESVLFGPGGAATRKLVIMCGGSVGDIARLGPLLAAFSQRVTRVGELGAGQTFLHTSPRRDRPHAARQPSAD
jgi:3-hydroxyisobutyrate dehydrogenase-like beta-hydroxyacid dehydrogenase